MSSAALWLDALFGIALLVLGFGVGVTVTRRRPASSGRGLRVHLGRTAHESRVTVGGKELRICEISVRSSADDGMSWVELVAHPESVDGLIADLGDTVDVRVLPDSE